MGAFGNFFRSLVPGDDRELARTQYAGRESASDRAAQSKTFGAPSRSAREADRRGHAWEDQDRKQNPGFTSWFSGRG